MTIPIPKSDDGVEELLGRLEADRETVAETDPPPSGPTFTWVCEPFSNTRPCPYVSVPEHCEIAQASVPSSRTKSFWSIPQPESRPRR